MKECVFCGKKTSFIFEGKGEFNKKFVCPSCQKLNFGTNFNMGCGKEKHGGNSCSIRFNLR